MSRSRSHTNSLFHCLSGAYALSSPGAPNRLGDVLHRLMYRVVALGGGRIQARLLRRMFDLHHREPDRWSYETSSYERERFAAVLRESVQVHMSECSKSAAPRGCSLERWLRTTESAR